MAYEMQDVLSTDVLRKRLFHLRDLSTLTIAANQDACFVEGLPDSGGTIMEVRGRCGTTPTGTVTGTRFDINVNGSTIFTATGSSLLWPSTTGGSAGTTAGSSGMKSSMRKVYNGDLITLDCDAISDGAAGANAGIVVIVRADCPND